jgi:hypothetical protein
MSVFHSINLALQIKSGNLVNVGVGRGAGGDEIKSIYCTFFVIIN